MFGMGLVRFTELCKALLRRGQLWIGVAWRLYHGCMELILWLHGAYTTVAWRLYHGCMEVIPRLHGGYTMVALYI